MRLLAGDRVGEASRALGRHRRMLSAVTEGAGLDALFALAAAELPARCWLLTGTGRLVAGTGRLVAGRADPPPRPLAQRLAREYLTAGSLPATVRVRGQEYTLVPSGGRPGLTGWFLACENRPDEAREPVTELAEDVGLERARLDATRGGERRLGRQIVRSLTTDGDPVQVVALLVACELPAQGPYLAVAARADPGSGDLAGLVEELVLPVAVHAAVGEDAGETLAVLPVPAETAGEPGLADLIREAAPVLVAGLRGGRLTVGISDVVTGPDGLPAALREARGARRLAESRPGQVSVVTGAEAGTHAMLLASVPADVLRSFRDRLLGPLLRYDLQHGTELMPTLAGFLACSGSWNAGAERLHVHVNTLRYRIRRIEELTGRDLATLDGQVDFYLALSAAGQRDLGPE
jgi:hypothetical protein